MYFSIYFTKFFFIGPYQKTDSDRYFLKIYTSDWNYLCSNIFRWSRSGYPICVISWSVKTKYSYSLWPFVWGALINKIWTKIVDIIKYSVDVNQPKIWLSSLWELSFKYSPFVILWKVWMFLLYSWVNFMSWFYRLCMQSVL